MRPLIVTIDGEWEGGPLGSWFPEPLFSEISPPEKEMLI